MIGIKDIIKPLASQNFMVGIGVAALAYFLAPQLKEAFRPAAVKGTQAVMTLGTKTKQMLDDGKEKISNLIFEKTEGTGTEEKTNDVVQEVTISSTVLKELREEREVSNKIMDELRNSIMSLKEEISHIKQVENFQQG